MKRASTYPKSASDLKRLTTLKDSDIVIDADAPAWTPEMFARAVVKSGLKAPPTKTLLSLRVDSDVVEWFRAQGRGYQSGTIWPVARKFRCAFMPALCEELGALAERHAEPELLDHLHIYEGTTALLEWHDAFANAMLLSGTIEERRIAAFAAELGLPHG